MTPRTSSLCAAFVVLATASTSSAQPTLTGQPVADCIPACRTGYLCVNGGCVSACNPPCAAGDTCTAQGDCLPMAGAATPPGPPPGPGPAPFGAAPPAAATPPPGGWQEVPAPATPEEAVEEPSGLVLLPRFAFLATGSGTWKADCEGSLCSDYSTGDESDYDDISTFGAGFDLLYHLGPSFRLGGGLFYNFTNEVDPDEDDEDFENGSDLSIDGIAEGFIRIGPKMFLAIRGQIGMVALIPGGDLDKEVNDLQEECSSLEDYYYGANCTADEGPYLGITYGGGAGFVFALSGVRLRLDLLLQGYSISADLQSVSQSGESAKIVYEVSGMRFWLAGGAEF